MSIKEVMRGFEELQEQLKTLDKDYDFAFDDNKHRQEVNARLVTKLEDLHNIQDKLVIFNIRGKQIKIYQRIIINSGYITHLSDLITNLEKEGKSLDGLKDILIDKDFNNTLVIFDLLRKKYYEKVLKFNESRIPFVIPEDTNVDQFKEDLEFFFKDDSAKVFDDFKIYYYDKNKDKKVLYGKSTDLTNLICNITCSSWYPNELHKPYLATCIDDIKSKTSFKAYFLNYQATLIIEFVEIIPIKFLEMQPFSTDQDVWFPNDGAGNTVFGSVNNVNWTKLGTIPNDYGNGTSVIFFAETNVKFIKIQAGEYGCSLGYFKVI